MLANIDKKALDKGFSGVIAISGKENVFHEKAYGYADRNNKTPNNISTRFGIASGTKLFTALAIGLLIDEGKLSLEDKVFDVLDYDFETYDKNVTVRQLLNHTSGIPDYVDEDEIEDFDNFHLSIPWFKLLNPEDYYPLFPTKPMVSEPGEKFKYSNSGFVLLAGIVSKISGTQYADFIEERITKPLGMNNTGFYMLNNLPENTAFGYIGNDTEYRTNVFNLPIRGGGDGGIYSNVYDLKKLWNSFLAGDIVSKYLVDQYIIPQAKPNQSNDESYYGYGLWIEKISADDVRIAVVGEDAGVTFISKYFLKNDSHYTVISNTSDGAWKVSQDCRDFCASLK